VLSAQPTLKTTRWGDFMDIEMKTMEATPTEYKGVEYRSKCEAMFARWLDICTTEHLRVDGFWYEPKSLSINGYTPDFLAWTVEPSQQPMGILPNICNHVIEYKPSRPTSAYIKKFENYARSVAKAMYSTGMEDWVYQSQWSIYYGSVYTETRGVIGFHPIGITGKSWDIDVDWLEGLEDELRSTRFDLVQPCRE
jgi:hypothetical protein